MSIEFGMPKVNEYIKYREELGKSMLQIQEETAIGEADVYALELAYRCYRKNIPLDVAIVSVVTDDRVEIIKSFVYLFESMDDEQLKTMVAGLNAQVNNKKTPDETTKTLSVIGEIIRELKRKE